MLEQLVIAHAHYLMNLVIIFDETALEQTGTKEGTRTRVLVVVFL